MPGYSTPGVYFEQSSRPELQIGMARTDIAGFVGITARGPLHMPVRVRSLSQFQSIFGGPIPNGFLPNAVDGFFQNGGDVCWVVRVADPGAAIAKPLVLNDERGKPALALTPSYRVERVADADTGPSATFIRAEDYERKPPTLDHVESPGSWASELEARIVRTAAERFTLILRLSGETREIWPGLTMKVPEPKDPPDPRSAVDFINKNSKIVSACVPDDTVPGTEPASCGFVRFPGGCDGLAGLSTRHLTGEGAPANKSWGLATLSDIDEIGIIAIPDCVPAPRISPQNKEIPIDCRELDTALQPAPKQENACPEEQPEYPKSAEGQLRAIHAALIHQCEALKNRFAILDPDWNDLSTDQIVARARDYDSDYAALYYPWVRVPDPLGLSDLLRTVPPSGFMAGVYARVDLGGGSRFGSLAEAGLMGRSGVHKSPANEEIEGVKSLAVSIDDATHGFLNDRRINVIRQVPGRGIRIVGARTLSSDSAWRYVAVRRLMTMSMVSIDRETQWIPFEPNNSDTWMDTERTVSSFMLRLWRRGMLDGATANDAFFVKCDQTTMSQDDRDNGRLICEIGLRPPWPAEFVIVRIGKTESGLEVL